MADAAVTVHDRVSHDFAYHPPVDDVAVRAHERVRGLLGDAAHRLVDLTPPGREQALMLTHLEEALMWANAAIARKRSATSEAAVSGPDLERQLTGSGRQDG